VFSVVGLLIACALSASAALFELVRTRRLVRVGRTARASVIAVNVPAGEEEEETAAITKMRFRTEEGLEVEVRERGASADDARRIGAEVLMIYDPEHPQQARRKAFAALWGPALFWLAMGALLGASALLTWLVSP
jgi:hypothetical protein